METKVHTGMVVSGLINFYDDLLFDYQEGLTVKKRLSRIAERLWQAFMHDNPVVLNQINNYNPKYLSRAWSAVKTEGFKKDDAYNTIANEYGFQSWSKVPDTPLDLSFERAIDALLAGDIKSLEQMLMDDPTLVERRSTYAHQAALLHYVGSNGVELYRQVVPSNLADCMILLLKHGSDKDATMPVYGGQFTMIDLLKTSAHPKAAGLLDSVVRAYEQNDDKLPN